MAEANNKSIEPLITQDLRSDTEGGWEINIEKDIPAGKHVISVEDEYGNQSEVLMYVVSDEPTERVEVAPPAPEIIERISTAVPPTFSWLMVTTFTVIIFLGFNLIRIASRADKLSQEISGKNRRHTRQALIILGIILFITAITGLLINRETNFLSQFLPKSAEISAVKVSGRLIDPQILSGVSGVDLASGSTSIRTSESGQYLFDNVSAEKGIRATSPALMRTLVFLPPAKAAEERFDIYFDARLFNSLVGIIDLEARGRLSDIYAYLPPAVTAKISREDFQLGAETIYGSQNISDQEIRIKKTELFDNWISEKYDLTFSKALAITVTANGRDAKYYFVWDNGSWAVVK